MVLPELVIGNPANLQATIQIIACAAREAFSADVCLIAAINPITQWVIEPPLLVTDKQAITEFSHDREWLKDVADKMLSQEVTLLDRSTNQGCETLDHLGLPQTKSLAAVTLRNSQHHKPLAILFIGYNSSRLFSATEQEDLQSFAKHAAATMKNTWLLRRYHEVARIGQEINQELESHEILFRKLSEGIADIIDTSYFFTLAVYQPQATTVDLYLSEKGRYRHIQVKNDFPTFQEKQSKLIRSYSQQVGKSVQNLKQIKETDPGVPESLVFVPLKIRDLTVGLISVQHQHQDVFDEEDLQILELIGNQVSQAISSLRLFEYLNDVNETGQQLVRQFDSENLFQELVDKIHETTKADIVTLYPYDEKKPAGSQFVMPPNFSGELLQQSFPKPYRINSDDVALLVLKHDEPVFEKNTADLYEKLGGDKSKRKGNFEQREQIRSTAALNLKVSDETVGVLFINYRPEQRFDAPQKTLLLSLANYAAIAIRDSRLLNQRRFLERLREVDRAISQSLDLKQVLHTLLIEATKIVPADEAAVLLYDEREKVLRAKAAIGSETTQRLKFGGQLKRGKGITFWVYENKKTVRVGNVNTDPKWKEIHHQYFEDTVSEMGVPLIDGDDVIGVINFESKLENAYTQADVDFITILAAQAVIAIKNAQMFEREEQIAFELLAMREIEHEIVSHLNLKELLEMILEKALKLTQSDSGTVLLYDSKQNLLYSGAERGVDPQYANLKLKEGEGVEWEAIKQKKLLNIDVGNPEWSEKFIPAITNAKWALVVPIPEGDKFRGVINIERATENTFTEREEILLSQLADLASIALQNAEQYEEAQKGRRQLEALHNVEIEITSQQGNIVRTIEVILESAGWLTSAEIAGLHFFEEGLPGKKYLSKIKKGKQSPSWEPINREVTIELSTEYSADIISYVFRTGEPYVTRGDAQNDPRYVGDDQIHSEVAVPLKIGNKVIGVLNLESPRHFAFDVDDVRVLELLAGQAEIAVQNARIFTEAKEESERFRLLLEVGRELGNISDPGQKENALDIVFNKIMQHSDGQIIYRRYDSNRQMFVLKKYERLRDTAPRDIDRNDGIDGQVSRERRAILVSDVGHLEEGMVAPHEPPNIKTLIVAPVFSEDRYYGNLTLRHEQAGFYQEADRLLLEGFATQLANTLRRLEVIEAQREAEHQARQLEISNELGLSAYEITHRLGNDLGLVTTYVNHIRDILAKQGIDSSMIDKELGNINEDVRRVLKMSLGLKQKVADIQGTGRPMTPPVITSVKKLLEEAKLALPDSLANIELVWEVDNDLGDARVVTGQVVDILYSLVANAIEAMLDGGRITVKAFKDDIDVYIKVADNGPGISPANLKKIFNLFFSTRNSSGFGLWSARRYAQANGGELTVSSQLGKGATFTLRLPLVRFGEVHP